MSTLAVNSITDANSGNTATINGMTPTADSLQGFRNRIQNGDMRIDQRNAGASVTLTSGGVYTVDRIIGFEDTDGAMTAQQDSSAPVGFVNSLKLTTTTADATLGSTQFSNIQQRIEGTNVSDLGWGTANAKTVTLSFWVRSSLTGTFGGSITNSAFNRSYPFTYTISVADTWEYKTVTIPGDTSGTWLTTSGIGLRIVFSMGEGSDYAGTAGSWTGSVKTGVTGAVSVIGTLNATWYITGVQLEVGSVATPFERRPYGTELALCQRYFCKTFSTGTAPAQNTGYTGALGAISINTGASTALWVHWQFPSEMRAVPTLTTFSPSAANANWYSPAGPSSTTTAGTFAGSTRFLNIYNTNAPAAGANIVYYIQATASSEL